MSNKPEHLTRDEAISFMSEQLLKENSVIQAFHSLEIFDFRDQLYVLAGALNYILRQAAQGCEEPLSSAEIEGTLLHVSAQRVIRAFNHTGLASAYKRNKSETSLHN